METPDLKSTITKLRNISNGLNSKSETEEYQRQSKWIQKQTKRYYEREKKKRTAEPQRPVEKY